MLGFFIFKRITTIVVVVGLTRNLLAIKMVLDLAISSGGRCPPLCNHALTGLLYKTKKKLSLWSPLEFTRLVGAIPFYIFFFIFKEILFAKYFLPLYH
jgi:hypothetical protein